MIRMGSAGKRFLPIAEASAILAFAAWKTYVRVRAQLSTDDHLAEPG
jgi:hypothetical protein